jgi:hypothetical protein
MAKVSYISGLKPRIGLNFAGQPITAQSTPVLDGWGWDEYWKCAEWQAWHVELRKLMSAKDAALVFKQAWELQDTSSYPYTWCKYNQGFRNYMRSQGINVDSPLSLIIMPVFDAAGNLLQGSSDIITNVTGGATFLSGLAKPLTILALVGGSYYVYKNYIK